MRRFALGAIGLLIFAGCLSAAANTESAQSLESTAADRADSGDLVALWGVEPPRHVESEDGKTTIDIYLDDAPGDGQAAGWSYAYVGEEKGGIVVVGDKIGVIAEAWHTFEANESDEILEEVAPITDWPVDSEEVADLLAADDRWPEITDSWAVLWRLMQTDEGPVWHVEASNITLDGFGSEAEAVVSASNGTILDIHRHDDPEEGVEGRQAATPTAAGGCTRDEASGQVTPLSDLEAEVTLEQDGIIAVRASYTGAGPLDISVLEDGDDEVFSDSILVTRPGSATFHVEDLDDGDYVVELSTDAGAVNAQLTAEAMWGTGGACTDADTASSSSAAMQPLPAAYWAKLDPTMGLAGLDGDLW